MSCTCSSRWGLSLRYCSAFWPSTPAAPLFCTTFFMALCRFSLFHTLSIKLNHWPPLIPLSRVSNMRSVHTLASVHSHFWATFSALFSLRHSRQFELRLCFFPASTFLSPLAPRSLAASLQRGRAQLSAE